MFVKCHCLVQRLGLVCRWCAEDVFCHDTINSERYMRLILAPVFDHLTDEERSYGPRMKNNVTAHTTKNSVDALDGVLGDRVTSRGLWPLRSPDFNLCDFYFWGTLKEKLHVNVDTLWKNFKKIQSIKFPPIPCRSFDLCLEIYSH
jgi:hypothetical protein